MRKMKMRRLFVCNTPYQIMVAMLINEEKKEKNDVSDIVLTDNFSNSYNIKECVLKTGYFDTTYYAQINKTLFPKNGIDKLKKYKYIFFPQRNINKIFLGGMVFYDEVYYNNDDIFLYNLVFCALKKNEQLSVFRFEEGYSSYTSLYCSKMAQKIFDFRCKYKGFRKFDLLLSELFFFEPELVVFDTDKIISRIPRNINETVRTTVKKIFNVPKMDNLTGKWIVFEESFFQDVGYMDDFYLYEKLIKHHGKDKIIVKLHPRTQKNRFVNMGVEIMEADGIPWEAFLVSNPSIEVTGIALASGSIINARLMLGSKLPAYLLYQCVEHDIPAYNENFELFVKKLMETNVKGVNIVENIDEWIKKIH